jgi:hypothetical protein
MISRGSNSPLRSSTRTHRRHAPHGDGGNLRTGQNQFRVEVSVREECTCIHTNRYVSAVSILG